MSWLGPVLTLVFLACVFFFFGALWRDGRACRREKGLVDLLKVLRLQLKSFSDENYAFKQFGKNGPDIKHLVEQADVYDKRVRESMTYTLEWAFNRGARQGLQAAVLRLRGWL